MLVKHYSGCFQESCVHSTPNSIAHPCRKGCKYMKKTNDMDTRKRAFFKKLKS